LNYWAGRGRIIGDRIAANPPRRKASAQALLQVWRVKFEYAMAGRRVNAMIEGRYG